MEKAKIIFWNETTGEGRVETECGESLTLSIKGCSRIVAGALGPEFYRHYHSLPKVGDEIRFTRRFGNVAFYWGYELYFSKAMQEMGGRKIYRVVARNRFAGQMMVGKRREEEVARGTREELQVKYPRLIVGDRLVPVYQAGPCRAEQRWQVLEKGGWIDCGDPRSKPASPMYRVMRFKDGKSEELGGGTAYDLQMESPRGSERDKFAQAEHGGESDGYTYFEVWADGDWRETADPRPKPVAKKATTRTIRAGGAIA